jgi:glutathione S-transferase
MAIVVHHLMHSRSLRALWLLEELGLDYELVRYERDANFRAPPSLEKAHPLGRAPVVVVDVGARHRTPLGFVERSLSERAYFAGSEFSAADIQMFYPVEAALARSKGAWPLLRAWRARVTARPAYRRAEEKGGPALPDR